MKSILAPRHLAMAVFVTAMGLGTWKSASAALSQDTLMIGKPSDPQTLDPAVTIDNNDWAITYPAYQRLVTYKTENGKGSTEVQGELAASWSTSPDNLTWEFKLKPGNKFDDGTEVNAEAVKFSFDRVMKLKQGPSGAFPDDMAVSTVDPMTVRFTLKAPYAPFLSTLAHNGAAIVNPAVAKKPEGAETYLSTHTAGSGAFKLVNWQKGQALTLEQNSYYAGPKPALNKVVVKIIGEASVRRLQLEHGDLDIIEDMPEDQLQALAKKPGIVIGDYPSLRVTMLYLNTQKAPMSNPDARRAIIESVDYNGIIQGILGGKAKPLNGPIPQGMWAYDETLPVLKQDLDKAKADLAKVSPKVSNLTFMYSDKDPNWEPIGLTLQAGLQSFGVNLKMEKLANASMRERLGSGDFDVAIGSWSPDFADPYMFMNFFFDSKLKGLAGNRSMYENPAVDKLIRESATTNEIAKRVELYQQAQKIVLNDSVYAYLYQKAYTLPMSDKIKGYVFNPMLEQVFNIGTITK
ncbi:dipeptide ABC transporter periplasmic protein [Pseudomonas poae RE*1-1-14]|uniref:ABC transporter substrate-binding protein n=1 Tax=Pseudomonas poae TaxID=200451 RepID=UPI0002AF5088|nr:ABC transporter substrate-binding protein [Pseudomonas poae]AGE24491.1 dipeptide ABC transporter periplasmic protein [Pseudomonas poae RE*1-1-14]